MAILIPWVNQSVHVLSSSFPLYPVHSSDIKKAALTTIWTNNAPVHLNCIFTIRIKSLSTMPNNLIWESCKSGILHSPTTGTNQLCIISPNTSSLWDTYTHTGPIQCLGRIMTDACTLRGTTQWSIWGFWSLGWSVVKQIVVGSPQAHSSILWVPCFEALDHKREHVAHVL